MAEDDAGLIGAIVRGRAINRTPATPTRSVTVFVVRHHSEFKEECRHLAEVAFPQLQSHFVDQGLDLHLVDPHARLTFDPAADPSLQHVQLQRMRECHAQSIACFCLCLLGSVPCPNQIPIRLNANQMSRVREAANSVVDGVNLMDKLYKQDARSQDFILNPDASLHHSFPEGISQIDHKLHEILQSSGDAVHFQSVAEYQFDFATSLSDDAVAGIVGVVTNNVNENANSHDRRDWLRFERKVIALLEPHGNLLRINDHAAKEDRLSEFGQIVTTHLISLVEKSVSELPSPLVMGRISYDVYLEASSHLSYCHQILSETPAEDSPTLQRVKELITGETVGVPLVVTGPDGCGKTTLLSMVASRVGGWLGSEDSTVCVVRYIGLTPRSTYMCELVRCLCFHLSLALNVDIQPKQHNFDLSKLLSWLETLLVTVQSASTQLVLLIDDLHLLKLAPSHNDVKGSLLWLPWRLPGNVHVVCTMTASSTSTLTVDRVLGSWKEKLESQNRTVDFAPLDESGVNVFVDTCLNHIRNAVSVDERSRFKEQFANFSHNLFAYKLFLQLSFDDPSHQTLLPTKDSNATQPLHAVVSAFLKSLEDKFGEKNVAQVARYLTCTRYGMTHHDLARLMDASHVQQQRFPLVTYQMMDALGILLARRPVDNRVLLSWRHRSLLEIVKSRYFPSQKAKRATHAEIANHLLQGFFAPKNDQQIPSDQEELPEIKFVDANHEWASVRPFEELWFHLLHTGDVNKIKEATVCNLHFLQMAVQAGSICYMLSVLELVRTQILDVEIELVYHTLRLGTDILSKEPKQLPLEIIAWLRQTLDTGLEFVECLVNEALQWCDSQTEPLLVPLTSWLWSPLPQQALVLSVPLGVTTITITHDSQYVICATKERILQMYHVASRQLIRTFTGHHDQVVCVHVEKSGQYLVSGSEDTTVIVWDLVAATPYRTISEHFATVTCVATTQQQTLVISGSDDGCVVIVQLTSGEVIHKLQHHRGPIVSVVVTENDDVLVTGSTDSTVCVWSLENYDLLNTITLPHPVVQMDLSCNSAFLLVACEDNNLYLRSLTTGSEIHTIRGRETTISQVEIAADNCRATIAYQDNVVQVYDIHTTKLICTLQCPSAPVTGIKISPDNSFLFTASGDKTIVWYFSRHGLRSGGTLAKAGRGCPNKIATRAHEDHVTCVDISKDGTLAISGSKDKVVRVWYFNQNQIHSILQGHAAAITCVAFAPNGLYAVSGSEDKTVRVWGLTLGLVVLEFKEHQAKVTAVKILSDSRRILSADANGILKLWQADSGSALLSCLGPTRFINVTNNMRFAICGVGDNSLRIWTVSREDHKHSVSHTDLILCHALTHDSKYVVTGSRDASLKIWDISTGRLTQVLVGHNGPVTCVSVAAYNHLHVFSGSDDWSVMIWDQMTGHDLHTLIGHCGPITCLKVTANGKIVISGSRDMTLRVWSSETGEPISCLDMHVPVVDLVISLDAAHAAVVLQNCNHLPLLCMHNHPTVVAEETPIPTEERIDSLPKKAPLRLLHKEMSLDTYTWQKRYGGIISKRSSTISLEDFRALSAAGVAPCNDKTNVRSGASSQSSSVSDVRSSHSTDSMPVPVAVAIATTEVVGMLNAMHLTLTKDDGPSKTEDQPGKDATPMDLDVAPWEAEEVRVPHRDATLGMVPNSNHNSEICIIM